MRSARRSARMKPVSLKVGCSPSIGRPSTCRAPKRCCWHCVSFSQQLLILCCNRAATCTLLRGAPERNELRSMAATDFRGISGNDMAANAATPDLINILDTVDVPIVVLRGDFILVWFNEAAADLLRFSPSD